MPQSPEPLEIATQINPSNPTENARSIAGGETFDAGREHARDLLGACDLDPEIIAESVRPSGHAAAEWATSGAMALTGLVEGPPRFVAGPIASAARGAALILGSLATDGRLEGLDGPALLGERAALFRFSRQGDRSSGGSARLLPTRDGTLALNLPRADDWHLVPAWLEADLPIGPNREPSANERDAVWRSIETLVRERESADLVDRGRLMGLAIATAPKPNATGPREPFFKIQGETESAPERGQGRLRLLDLSTLWAGPLATSLLARAGVEVLKIESPTRPDGARRAQQEGARPFFDLMNGDKLGCALDLRDARDRQVFERLLEAADIVVESARPRALSQLGYDAASWTAARAGRIWASITGYGRENEWIAFGDDAAVAAGLAWSPLPEEPDACFCADAIADPLTGLHLAAIVLAHLRQGRGGLLDISLSGIAQRAATAADSGLVLPIERGPSGWGVVDGDRIVRVASPRARPITRPAPELVAPNEALLSPWLGPKC